MLKKLIYKNLFNIPDGLYYTDWHWFIERYLFVCVFFAASNKPHTNNELFLVPHIILCLLISVTISCFFFLSCSWHCIQINWIIFLTVCGLWIQVDLSLFSKLLENRVKSTLKEKVFNPTSLRRYKMNFTIQSWWFLYELLGWKLNNKWN